MGLFTRRNKGSQTEMSGGGTAHDPVCHMDVQKDRAAATSEYQGQTYYFCAAACKKAFDKDPAQYLGDKGQHETQSGHGGHGGHGCCG